MALRAAKDRLKQPKTARNRPSKAASAALPAPRKRPAAARTQPYHHGDLHEKLLQAAERVLERDGLAGLTLRAVAREAGVSHAAPTHHFGDLTGLVSELAAVGFCRFGAALSGAARAAPDPEGAAEARARAYIGFAQSNPGLFQLMFRTERLDHQRPALREAADAAFRALVAVVARRRGEEISTDQLTLAQAADVARLWSLVHGFAMLHLDGRLHDILIRLPEGAGIEALLAAMLKPDTAGN